MLSGSYGEFLRVDFTKNYGDLGANMQAVKWTYYGNDSTRSKALATYGTKFAADNWMHKSNGNPVRSYKFYSLPASKRI